MSTFFRLDKNSARTFKILASLSLVYVFPIILANAYYVDDWRRGMSGFAGWEYDGRPLTSWMMMLVNFGFPLLDVSPFSLILGLSALCYALVLFARKYFNNCKPMYSAVILFFFVANPFFLENLSFKYDSLSMCIALSLVILFFSIEDSVNIWKLCIFAIICNMAVLNIYQPALCSFFCLLVIKFIFDILHKKGIKYIITIQLILLFACFLSLILYKWITVYYYIDSNNQLSEYWYMSILAYAKGHSESLGIHDGQLLLDNIKNFFQLIDSYRQSLLYFIVVIALLLIFMFISGVIHSFLKNYRHINLFLKVIISLILLFSPFIIFVNSFLLMTIIKEPILRYRVLLSFGCFMLLIGISIYYISLRMKCIKFVFILFLLFAFSFSFIYGNVADHQKSHDLVFFQKFSYDIEEVSKNHKNSSVLFISAIGSPPLSRQLRLACSRFPFFKNIFYMYYDNVVPFYIYALPNYTHFNYIAKIDIDNDDMLYISGHKPDVDNGVYKIYDRNWKIIIIFNDYTETENRVKDNGDIRVSSRSQCCQAG